MKIGGVLIVDRWSYRDVARRFYPGKPSMQRKWLRAHRRAPGPRCAIGTRCEEELRERCLGDAIAYLRTTRRGYAGDVLGRPAPIKSAPPPSPDTSDGLKLASKQAREAIKPYDHIFAPRTLESPKRLVVAK